jgi:hypothetical protein
VGGGSLDGRERSRFARCPPRDDKAVAKMGHPAGCSLSTMGIDAALTELQVSPLCRTIEPSCSGRDDKVLVGMANALSRCYSYFRVATGSRMAARLAGRVPKITPTATEVAREMTAAQ